MDYCFQKRVAVSGVKVTIDTVSIFHKLDANVWIFTIFLFHLLVCPLAGTTHSFQCPPNWSGVNPHLSSQFGFHQSAATLLLPSHDLWPTSFRVVVLFLPLSVLVWKHHCRQPNGAAPSGHTHSAATQVYKSSGHILTGAHVCLYAPSDTHWWLSWRFTVVVKWSCKRVVGASRSGSGEFINWRTHTHTRVTHRKISFIFMPLSPRACLFVFRPISLAAFQDSIIYTVALIGFHEGPLETAIKIRQWDIAWRQFSVVLKHT